MNPTPVCRHLHTDGRPCGSPALRGEPFCFHHHTARKPMPKRADLTANPRLGLACPQLPAPDDFPAIQRALGEVLRLLVNGELAEARAQTLFRGLAIASQNLARQHRREEKLEAEGRLAPAVTAFVNHPQYGTLAPASASELPVETPAGIPAEIPAAGHTTEEQAGCPTSEQAGCPTFGTVSPCLRWAREAGEEATERLPDPIPVFTPDPSPTTSFDQAKSIEINNYFQGIDDKRRERSAAWLAEREAQIELELEARYDDRLAEFKADAAARLQTEVQSRVEAHLIETSIQRNQDLTAFEENVLAMAS